MTDHNARFRHGGGGLFFPKGGNAVAYKTYREELMDKWRCVDLPVREALEVLKAALYLDAEKTEAIREAVEVGLVAEGKTVVQLLCDARFIDFNAEWWALYDRIHQLYHLVDDLDTMLADFYCLKLWHYEEGELK